MKTSCFKVLVVGLVMTACGTLVADDDAKDKAIDKDREQIAGTWKIVGLEIDGKKTIKKDARKLTVVNGSDGTWSLRSEGKEVAKGISTIDPTMKPKTIDFRPTEGSGKDGQYLGIYELGKKNRRLCFAPSGMPRPSEFASPSGSGNILVTFKRVKDK